MLDINDRRGVDGAAILCGLWAVVTTWRDYVRYGFLCWRPLPTLRTVYDVPPRLRYGCSRILRLNLPPNDQEQHGLLSNAASSRSSNDAPAKCGSFQTSNHSSASSAPSSSKSTTNGRPLTSAISNGKNRMTNQRKSESPDLRLLNP